MEMDTEGLNRNSPVNPKEYVIVVSNPAQRGENSRD